jgi:predicted N-acetyltransferase YhbS
VDFTLAPGSPDPDLTVVVSLAWMHLKRPTVVSAAMFTHRFARHTDDHELKRKPVVSLLAFQDDRAVGHILFTRARLEPDAPLSCAILAPLAVTPGFQEQGIGGRQAEQPRILA